MLNQSLCGLRNGNLHLQDWRISNKPQSVLNQFNKSINKIKHIKDSDKFIISSMDNKVSASIILLLLLIFNYSHSYLYST